MKICLIGAGSSYTPELVEGLSAARDTLPVDEVALCDINEDRLKTIHGFCQRFAKRLGLKTRFTRHTDRREALRGADFVNVQIRVGGNAARAHDERIPLSMGLVGQETTGPGGMMKGLRTIPVMVDIARDARDICPDAWIINYANPTGMVTAGVLRATGAKIAGLCSGGMYYQEITAKALGVEARQVRYDLAGLNHMHFAYNFTVNGRPLTPEDVDKICLAHVVPDFITPDLWRLFGAIPSGYLMYYYRTAKMVEKARGSDRTRAEVIMELEKELFAELADEKIDTKPASLAKRGGGGYSGLAISVMSAIRNNTDSWIVVNVPNRHTLPFLPENAVIEVPCMVNVSGIRPIATEPPSTLARGIISAVNAYEELAVEAALTGSGEAAILALAAHPLVRDLDVARELWGKLLEANRPYLPQFAR